VASVELSGVRKQYDKRGGHHVAVNDLHLQIREGELVVLVGPSGSGKSTILRMIAGLETMSAGELKIGGRVVNDVPAGERDVAMVFQNYALYPHMTAYENLAFGLKLRKVPGDEIDRRVRAAATILGIEELLERRPRQMSGGEQQRVALGRAIVRQPQVFLLDEPLSNLDAKLRIQLRREITRLHQQLGTTMIYVTHDQAEAMTLGDRIVVLDRGAVQQVDKPGPLYQRPRNIFVAGYIGSPPMNLLEGRLRQSPSCHFEAAGFTVALSGACNGAAEESRERAVFLGVRPEDLHPVTDGGVDPDRVIPARVDLVELFGGEALVHLNSGGVELTALLAAPAPAAGGDMRLVVAPERVHLFDGATGERIERRS
jgi:multiple sugar transport system ATP-binding protein